MSIDQNAVARGVGIETTYKDLRENKVVFLPQRIAVFAQGASAVTYSEEKWEAPSASAAGQRFGFGSPIHLILRELKPIDGDGVGVIPVTVYPLPNPSGGGAAAASGSIAPSGTASDAGTYRLRIGGVLSQAFAIPKGPVSVAEIIGRMGDAVSSILHMPVNVSYTFGSVTSTPKTNTGNGTLTSLSVQSGQNPRPGQWTLVCNTQVTHGGVFTLTDPNGTVISNTVTMTPGTGGATALTVGGLQFTLTDGSTDFAVGDGFTIAVPATALGVVAKWKGVSSNAIVIEVLGDSLGVIFTITQPTGGLVNPTVDAALARVGSVRETMAINALNVDDTTALDAYMTFGEARWNLLVRKPLVFVSGTTKKLVADATAIPAARRSDRVNAVVPAPGSPSLPFVVAARAVARAAKQANDDPATDYGALRLTGIIPGADGDQWDYNTRDQAIKAGSSTVEVNDGVVEIGDMVTFYHPLGETPPAYSYVRDIVCLQNILYNIDLIFSAAEWARAPLIPDDQPTVNPNARKPRSAITEVVAKLDELALQAILADPAFSKKNTTASLDANNPRRLNIKTIVKMSGVSGIKDCELQWGFNFGTTQLAA